MHAINFHSTVRDSRSSTLRFLAEFLSAVEAKHSDLLYLHDEDLYELVNQGSYRTPGGSVHVNVTRRNFTIAKLPQKA